MKNAMNVKSLFCATLFIVGVVMLQASGTCPQCADFSETGPPESGPWTDKCVLNASTTKCNPDDATSYYECLSSGEMTVYGKVHILTEEGWLPTLDTCSVKFFPCFIDDTLCGGNG